MGLVTCDFTAYLAKILESSDVYMTLSSEAEADLLKLLNGSGSYTYLSLKDNTNYETVKAYVVGGKVIIDRGLAGTTATRHPVGTCIASISPTVIQAMYDMYCLNPDMDNTSLGLGKSSLSNGSVGTAYFGFVYFQGALPMSIECSGAPSWATVACINNMVTFNGTPDASGTSTLAFKVSNVEGTFETTRTLKIV